MIHLLINKNILFFILIFFCSHTNANFFKPFDIVDHIDSKSSRIPNNFNSIFLKKIVDSNAIKIDQDYLLNNIRIFFKYDEFYGTPLSHGFYLVLDKSYGEEVTVLFDLIELFSEEKIPIEQRVLVHKACEYGNDRLLINLKKYDVWMDSSIEDNGCRIITYIAFKK